MSAERITTIALFIAVLVLSLVVGSLYSIVKVQQEQIATLQVVTDRQRNQLDDFNRKLAATEIKLEFCLDLTRKLQQPQRPGQ